MTCVCASCVRTGSTHLFSDVTADTVEIPADVEAMDGVESTDEAHNVERPARASLQKKRAPKGKPLSEFTAGEMVKGTIRSLTTYGAFCDFGAASDGLLHISRISDSYVKDVKDILSLGQEVEVRIVSIDAEKGQVALSLLTQEQEAAADSAAKEQPKRQASSAPRAVGGQKREDSAILDKLSAAGWDSSLMVEGLVASTLPFGAFVRVDASQLVEGMEGSFDGLVHISALTAGRASSVAEYAKVGDKVQVRVKSIGDGKVSLSMVSEEDEQSAREEGRKGNDAPVLVGAADWEEQLQARVVNMPVFFNGPAEVINKRK
jgi:elongation factor Ts